MRITRHTIYSAKAKYVQHLVNKLEQENIKLIIENQFYDNLVDIN